MIAIVLVSIAVLVLCGSSGCVADNRRPHRYETILTLTKPELKAWDTKVKKKVNSIQDADLQTKVNTYAALWNQRCGFVSYSSNHEDYITGEAYRAIVRLGKLYGTS